MMLQMTAAIYGWFGLTFILFISTFGFALCVSTVLVAVFTLVG